jgi:hypothetical protein
MDRGDALLHVRIPNRVAKTEPGISSLSASSLRLCVFARNAFRFQPFELGACGRRRGGVIGSGISHAKAGSRGDAEAQRRSKPVECIDGIDDRFPARRPSRVVNADPSTLPCHSGAGEAGTRNLQPFRFFFASLRLCEKCFRFSG